MVYVSIKKTPPVTDGEIQKKAKSLRVLKYCENKAIIDSVLSRKNALSRQNSILAYELLDSMLLSLTEAKTAALDRDGNGKSYIKNVNVAFNISHTDGAVACIIDTEGNDVGIDIEQIGRDGGDIIDRFFDDAARKRHADAANKPLSFAQIWTEKEAYSKFLGTGITDYKTDYPKPHLFTHSRHGQHLVTVCTMPDSQIEIWQKDKEKYQMNASWQRFPAQAVFIPSLPKSSA